MSEKATKKAEVDMNSLEDVVESSIVRYLSKETMHEALLTKVSLYLRARGTMPQESLKKFILQRPNTFCMIDPGDGRHRVRLRFSPGIGVNCLKSVSGPVHGKRTNGTMEKEEKSPLSRRQYESPLCLRNGTAQGLSEYHNECEHVPVGIPPEFDIGVLERHLVASVAAYPKSSPATLPSLGEGCIKSLGFSMKGLLGRFIAQRPNLFVLSNDGRQHVTLTESACQSVGLPALEKLPKDDELLETEEIISPKKEILLAIDYERGRSKSTYDCNQIEQKSLEDKRMSRVLPSIYQNWDPVTQKVFDYVLSKGGTASFKSVTTFMRKEQNQELLHQNGFENPLKWQAKNFSYNRRNIFRKHGTSMVVLPDIMRLISSTSSLGQL